MVRKIAITLLVAIVMATGILPSAFVFADSDVEGDDVATSAPGVGQLEGSGAGYNKETKQYFPGGLYASDIAVLVQAKILKNSIYKKDFTEFITAKEMNKTLRALHKFLGGAKSDEPATVVDSQVTGGGGPVSAVERGEAVGSLAIAMMNARPSEWVELRGPFFEFLSKNSASATNGTVAPTVVNVAELEKGGGTVAVPQANPGISREEIFMLVSRMVWQFEQDKLKKVAPAPETPYVLNTSYEEFYKHDVYLYWVPVKNAAKYVVRLYDQKGKPTKIITVSAPVLNITADGDPSFESIFGDPSVDHHMSFTVQAVSEHGMKSQVSEPVIFSALHYYNARERFGRDYIKYSGGEEGKAHQTVVNLNVWRDVGGERVPATVSFSVNAAVAESVTQIFGEYFNGAERFPIQSIGGFAVRSKRSEHNYGTAIDINPNENFMVGPKGITAGTFWDPSRSQYSIAPDSELVRAFERHGWYWAGNGWGSTYDYMHFSYLAT